MAVLFTVMFALFAIGLPIAFSISFSAVVYILLSADKISGLAIIQRIIVGSDSFIFLAVPFFMLAGELMNAGGVTQRLISFSKSIIGRARGGLAYVVVIVNMIMAGVSGSSIADAAAVGSIMIPTMEKEGYTKRFACTINATAATIGPIIPPSIGFVIYASITSVSVGQLFLAGAIPGVIMGLLLMVTCYIEARRKNLPRSEKSSLKKFFASAKESYLAMLMPLIIIGGILTGIVTPTEAAVVAVVYGLVVGMFVYKELKVSDLPLLLSRAGKQSAVVMFIVACANAFGWILSYEGVPEKLLGLFNGITTQAWVFLILINVLMLILGCFMEVTSIQIVLTPILMSIVTSYGIDLVHFGVIMLLNLMIGQLTPPVGMLLFVISGIGRISVHEIVAESWPFLIALLVALILITYIPQISLFLPNLIAR